MIGRRLAVLDPPRACVVRRCRRSSREVLATAILVVGCVWSSATAADTSLFRVILKDGTALTSYGEYARAGGRVVFSMPFGSVAAGPQLQVISLPESAVDWASTERYADSVRYARYLETRAEADYAALTGEIASRLNELTLASDPKTRLEVAEKARRLLIEWPATHFGYRSKDIREMVALLDEAITEFRAKAGAQAFDLSLVAIVDPPSQPLLPDPMPEQVIDQALVAARLADNSVERTSLLRSVIAYIDQWMPELPQDWAKRSRASALGALRTEVKIDQSYAKLRDRAIASAQKEASAADVSGVSDVIGWVKHADQELGEKRSAEIDALMAHLEAKLDAARRLRLARDRWALRSEALLAYRDRAETAVEMLNRLKKPLAEIRAVSGPDPRTLPKLRQRVADVRQRLSQIAPPPEVASLHAMLVSACHLAGQAVDVREQAVMSEDMRLAWDASAAASGSTMLLLQAWTDMQALFKPPELR